MPTREYFLPDSRLTGSIEGNVKQQNIIRPLHFRLMGKKRIFPREKFLSKSVNLLNSLTTHLSLHNPPGISLDINFRRGKDRVISPESLKSKSIKTQIFSLIIFSSRSIYNYPIRCCYAARSFNIKSSPSPKLKSVHRRIKQ